ncbi:MAG: DotI/IcmL family type IV secretion protein [Proteobacteria bacterium]|nr:DotI/IcmL family type IV secretion protein [Pseudomonadota bacterium]
MQRQYKSIILGILLSLSFASPAQPVDNAQLSVWANEAIVATYSYNYQNFLTRQKEIAKYFTSEGWMAYSKALNDAKLPQSIQDNSYAVSAVATLPPTITTVKENEWQASMPILVLYQNPQYKQTQTLNVILRFTEAKSGTGVRGLAIISLDAKEAAPACKCQPNVEATP